jgi:hypothetical protein
MGRFVAGLVLGAVLSGLTCYAFFAHQESESFPTAAAVEVPLSTSVAPESDGDDSRLEGSRSTPDPSTYDIEAAASTSDSREVQLERLIAESSAADMALRSELQALRTTKFREQRPIVVPLPLPPEFGWLADTNYVNPHDEIQREHRDAAWAAAAESEIQEYLRDHPEIFRAFGYPTIECRTSRCAVAFVVYGVDEDVSAMNRRFDTMVSDFSEQAWAEQFPDTAALYGNQQGDVHTIYWALTDVSRAIEVRRSQSRN